MCDKKGAAGTPALVVGQTGTIGPATLYTSTGWGKRTNLELLLTHFWGSLGSKPGQAHTVHPHRLGKEKKLRVTTDPLLG